MEVKMNNVQGRLLLEESRYILKEYHNVGHSEGYGRANFLSNWWNKGNGDKIQYFLDRSFTRYDFNAIWKTMK